MPVVSAAVAASAEAYRSKASDACGDEDLMGSALDGLNGAPTLGASDVAPMPTVLSKDSSSSKDDDAEVGSSLASGREETASKGHGRSTKTSHLEESEAESEEHPPPAQPQDPTPPVGSPRTEDAEMVDAAQGILYLSKCFSSCAIMLCFHFFV